MIPVIELVKSLRYELGDMIGMNISDTEIIEPINRAVSLLYGTLSERYVHAVIKRRPIVIDSTKTYALPSDFLRIHQLVADNNSLAPSSINPPKDCEYRIVGTELFADEGVYSLEYYYLPSRVTELSDYLDAPETMRVWVEQIALAYYRKDMNTAAGLVQQAENVLSGREISHFENTGPMQVLGGRI